MSPIVGSDVDYFGVGSMAYLSNSWRDGARFNCTLSSSRDFVGETPIGGEVFTSTVVCDLFLQPPRAPWLSRLLEDVRLLVSQRQLVHFFDDKALLPADTDCTSYAYSVALKVKLLSVERCKNVARQVVENVTSDGIIQVYFDKNGAREGIVDPAVCINALYFLNQMSLESEAKATEDFVMRTLESGAYLKATRYYPSPDTFLFFLARLVGAFPWRYSSWTPRVIEALRARIGTDSRTIELAQRALAATRLGLDAALDIWTLRQNRGVDGSFRADALFRYGKTPRYFGGEFVTTAFAARALLEYGRALRFGAFRPRSNIKYPHSGAQGVATSTDLSLLAGERKS